MKIFFLKKNRGHFWTLFWFPGLVRKGTYKFTLVRSYVRPLVRSGSTALTVQYFVLIFCMKLCLHMT